MATPVYILSDEQNPQVCKRGKRHWIRRALTI